MTKVILDGEYIELDDNLEKGKVELDLLEENNNNLEDTIEVISLENTTE